LTPQDRGGAGSTRADIECISTSEEARLLVENEAAAIAAVIGYCCTKPAVVGDARMPNGHGVTGHAVKK
jgi:hypothetical protein